MRSSVAGAESVGREYSRKPGLLQQYGALLVRLGVLVDSAVIFVALYTLTTYFGPGWNERYLIVATFGILCFVALASFFNLYRSWRLIRLREELAEILLRWTAAAAMITAALFFVLDSHRTLHPGILLLWYSISFLGITAFHMLMRLLLRYYRAFGYDHRRIAFVGATETANRLAGIFKQLPWMGIDVVGCYDDAWTGRQELQERQDFRDKRIGFSGSIGDLLDLVSRGRIDAVYITLPMSSERQIKSIIDAFSDSTVSIYYCPNFTRFDPLNARWDDIFGQPVISVVDTPFSGYGRHLKRLEDLFLAGVILTFIAPSLALIAAIVKLTSSGPVFYLQNRHGVDGTVFRIYKFRTMYVTEVDNEFVQAKADDARITPVGAFLRRTSLDELPQLFNVLKGNMSVVGPRPHPTLLNETHRKLIYRYSLRHKVKPGITGWAQVNGYRGETETLEKMEKRIEYDLEYIRNWSIWLDMKVLALTVMRAFSDKNAR